MMKIIRGLDAGFFSFFLTGMKKIFDSDFESDKSLQCAYKWRDKTPKSIYT